MSKLRMGPHLFCKDCGAEIDEHDVNINVAQWGYFRFFCGNCVDFNIDEEAK